MAKSNKQWLRRHVTDPYVRKAREQGYRSRAAYKLIELDFCQKALKSDGVFVLKAFHGETFDEVLQRLKRQFGKVAVRKPEASRGESRETYVVARNPRKMQGPLQPQKTGASL